MGEGEETSRGGVWEGGMDSFLFKSGVVEGEEAFKSNKGRERN